MYALCLGYPNRRVEHTFYRKSGSLSLPFTTRNIVAKNKKP